MLETLTKRGVHRFYQRWSPRVFAFCRLLFGDEAEAGKAVKEAFHAYFERDLPLDWAGLPTFLFVFALDGAKNRVQERTGTAEGLQFEEALLFLPIRDRAVFILRNVMDLEEVVVGEIVEIPAHEVRKRWMRSLMRMRELQAKDYFKEQRG